MEGRSWNRSGTWLVAVMIGFGLLLTGTLYVYTMLHTAPYRSLTAAIAKQYPGSAPRVEGGKRRLNEPGERILRITMQTPFDPATENADGFARNVVAFVADRYDLQAYDVVELNLFQKHHDGTLSQRSIRLNVEETVPKTIGGGPRNDE